MNSKTAKLIREAARWAALIMVTKDGRYHPRKHMGDYDKVLKAVNKGLLRNMKRGWKGTPWRERHKRRRQYKHMIMKAEHALAKGMV